MGKSPALTRINSRIYIWLTNEKNLRFELKLSLLRVEGPTIYVNPH